MTRIEKIYLLSLALTCLLTIGCQRTSSKLEPEPGTELYAVDPGRLTEVFFSSEQKKIYAFRWKTDGKFMILVASSGTQEVEQCTAAKGFDDWLGSVASMRVSKEVKNPRPDPPRSISAVLRLRDTGELEDVEVRLQIPSTGDEPPQIYSGEKHYAVEVDSRVLRIILDGCRVLAK